MCEVIDPCRSSVLHLAGSGISANATPLGSFPYKGKSSQQTRELLICSSQIFKLLLKKEATAFIKFLTVMRQVCITDFSLRSHWLLILKNLQMDARLRGSGVCNHQCLLKCFWYDKAPPSLNWKGEKPALL